MTPRRPTLLVVDDEPSMGRCCSDLPRLRASTSWRRATAARRLNGCARARDVRHRGVHAPRIGDDQIPAIAVRRPELPPSREASADRRSLGGGGQFRHRGHACTIAEVSEFGSVTRRRAVSAMVVRPHRAAGRGQASRKRVIARGVFRHAVENLDGEADVAVRSPAAESERLVAGVERSGRRLHADLHSISPRVPRAPRLSTLSLGLPADGHQLLLGAHDQERPGDRGRRHDGLVHRIHRQQLEGGACLDDEDVAVFARQEQASIRGDG